MPYLEELSILSAVTAAFSPAQFFSTTKWPNCAPTDPNSPLTSPQLPVLIFIRVTYLD